MKSRSIHRLSRRAALWGGWSVLVLQVAVCLLFVSTATAVPVNLGGAADYAILGTGGPPGPVGNRTEFEVYQSATVVNGNVGMGPNTDLTHNIDATINGRFDYDLTSSIAGVSIPKVPTGGVHQIDLSAAVAAARAASALAASYAPTLGTVATIAENATIALNHGLNVLRVTGTVTLKQTLTISGYADSSLIVQFTSSETDGHVILCLSGMTMFLTGGVLADNIVWSLDGAGDLGGIKITSGSVVYGNFLAPDRDILGDHAIVGGRLIGGGNGNLLSVHSSSEITVPVSVPDSGSTLELAGVALLGLGVMRKKLVEGRQ